MFPNRGQGITILITSDNIIIIAYNNVRFLPVSFLHTYRNVMCISDIATLRL